MKIDYVTLYFNVSETIIQGSSIIQQSLFQLILSGQ